MKGFLLVVAACFFWAVDTLIRYPLLERGIHPVTIVFYEHLFLCLCLVPLVVKSWRKIWHLNLGHMVSFVIIGAGGSGLANIFFTKALSLANPSAVMLLQKLQIVFSVLAARLILGESLKRGFLFWCALTTLGTLLVSYPELGPPLREIPLFSLVSVPAVVGYACAVLAALCWGLGASFGRKLGLSGYTETRNYVREVFLGACGLPSLPSLPAQGHLHP